MGLFDIFKKKEKTACDCAGACEIKEASCCSSEVKEETGCCSSEESSIINEDGEEMAECECGSMCKVSDIEAKKAAETSEGGMVVKVLGSGCKKCNQLEESTAKAIEKLGVNAKIEHVTDFGKIAAYGVMQTPALVINEKVVSFGKVLKEEEVIEILKTY